MSIIFLSGVNINYKEPSTQTKLNLGCFPLYPPLELFHSMEITPVILWGLKNSVDRIDLSDRHLQNYACSIARHLTEYILRDDGLKLDGLFMYNACDTLRNLPEVLESGLFQSNRELLHHPRLLPLASGQSG